MRRWSGNSFAGRVASGIRAHALPLAILALAFLFGVAIADDYGWTPDQNPQRRMGQLTVDLAFDRNDVLFTRSDWRYYGPVFEVALVTLERALGSQDKHHILLSRYIASHLFFLLGAFACYLLAKRMFGSRGVALFVMLCYLLHPRIYAHSFFNGKDTPFLGMFMIALLLAHTAFRQSRASVGSVPAFGLLGAWLGLIATVRPWAFVLAGLVLAARAVDFVRRTGSCGDAASGCGQGEGRRRVLASTVAFALLLSAGVFAGLPHLWAGGEGDPAGRLVEWLSVMADHPRKPHLLFLGEVFRADDRPWTYVPLWIALTTPAPAILLALLGCATLGARVVAHPRETLTNTPLRFEALVAAAALGSIAAATFWVGSIYAGWRQLYFLHAPICLLAGAGLAWLASAAGRRLTVLARGAAAVGLGGVVCWLVALHPHQHVYFNYLVDRVTPERLGARFDLDYWSASFKEVQRGLLKAFPEGEIPLAASRFLDQHAVLPREQRERFASSNDFSALLVVNRRYWLRDLFQTHGQHGWHSDLTDRRWIEAAGKAPTMAPGEAELLPEGAGGLAFANAKVVHATKVFSNTLYLVFRLRADAAWTPALREHERTVTSMPPAARGGFDVYWDGRAVTYVKRDCRPEHVDVDFLGTSPRPWPHAQFYLRVFGDKKAPLAAHGDGGAASRARRRHHNEDFLFLRQGVVFGAGVEGEENVCMASVDLGDYEVEAIRTGQRHETGGWLWDASIVARPPASNEPIDRQRAPPEN